jgi:hypothetical protein
VLKEIPEAVVLVAIKALGSVLLFTVRESYQHLAAFAAVSKQTPVPGPSAKLKL